MQDSARSILHNKALINAGVVQTCPYIKALILCKTRPCPSSIIKSYFMQNSALFILHNKVLFYAGVIKNFPPLKSLNFMQNSALSIINKKVLFYSKLGLDNPL